MARATSQLDANLAHALELFTHVKAMHSRKMFGGAGIYSASVMFALVTGDGIYLKADDQTKAEFEAAGSSPFHYTPPSGKRPVTMNYWRLPDSAADDAEEAMGWAQKAIDAAQKAKPPAPRRGPRP
ncbi:MAG: TfoX/Sxy family protein [Caulobacterales bacterium]